MSGVEIVSVITIIIKSIGYCIQVYDASRDTVELPRAFKAVCEGLPLAQNTLALAAEQATSPNANSQDVEVVCNTAAGTRQKIKDLNKILRKIRNSRLESRNSSMLLAYRSVVLKLGGKDHAVEVRVAGRRHEFERKSRVPSGDGGADAAR
ncbi:hypothetical protein ColLi_13277 [Colletotrichum liriopes]|uniref:NACHT-NTPase and P-loop NTPases N-terminal domain-containing protein n=1 Tax=Colletotrichum liriopes TaxID=708192 RepID=A0AA37H0T3_9PEZI|nr:hypothetical protein ColLi_13277 [Colletotrichum liriopes]